MMFNVAVVSISHLLATIIFKTRKRFGTFNNVFHTLHQWKNKQKKRLWDKGTGCAKMLIMCFRIHYYSRLWKWHMRCTPILPLYNSNGSHEEWIVGKKVCQWIFCAPTLKMFLDAIVIFLKHSRTCLKQFQFDLYSFLKMKAMNNWIRVFFLSFISQRKKEKKSCEISVRNLYVSA